MIDFANLQLCDTLTTEKIDEIEKIVQCNESPYELDINS